MISFQHTNGKKKGLTCKVYYLDKARSVALNNSQQYHVVAWAKKGSSIVFGTNSIRCSTKFERVHPDGTKGFHLHAEMDLMRQFKPGTLKEIAVARFLKNGSPTMSKPCCYCERFLKNFGVRKVYYTDWSGQWKIMRLQSD